MGIPLALASTEMLAYFGPASARNIETKADPANNVYKSLDHAISEAGSARQIASMDPDRLATLNAYSSSAPLYATFEQIFFTKQDTISDELSSSPPSDLARSERYAALDKAECYCESATSTGAINAADRANHLRTLFSNFVFEARKLSRSGKPYSLLRDEKATHTELDIFNAIRCIESPGERAELWHMMTDVFSLHDRQPRTIIEQKQAACLFFNSAYVDDPSIPQVKTRVKSLASRITCQGDGSGSFMYALMQLNLIKDATEQAHVAERIVFRIMFMLNFDQRNALRALREFLPTMASLSDATKLSEIAATLYTRHLSQEIVVWQNSINDSLQKRHQSVP